MIARDAAALARTLEARFRGAAVRDARIAGPALVALELRGRGTTDVLAFSVLPGAVGAVVSSGPVPASAAGMEAAERTLRDAMRAALVGARVERVEATAAGDILLGFARDGERTVLGFVSHEGRPDLQLRRAGQATLGLRRVVDASEAPAAPSSAPAGAEPPDLAAEPLDLDRLRERIQQRRRTVLARRAVVAASRRARQALAATTRLVERRRGDVLDLGEPEELRLRADALAAHLHSVCKGQEELVVPGWGRDGGDVTVPLDAASTPSQNLQRAYVRVARASRGRNEATRRLAEAEVAMARARTALDALSKLAEEVAQDIPTDEALAAAEELADVTAPLPGRKERPARKSGPRRYRSRDGHEILVGRSAAGNDELTFRIARGNDLWLHAREAPGPHVVARLPKGSEVPTETLLDAATLAHAMSKRGRDVRGEVTWCRVKNVRRVKNVSRGGARHGEVHVTQERVIDLRVDAERLGRLQATET